MDDAGRTTDIDWPQQLTMSISCLGELTKQGEIRQTAIIFFAFLVNLPHSSRLRGKRVGEGSPYIYIFFLFLHENLLYVLMRSEYHNKFS